MVKPANILLKLNFPYEGVLKKCSGPLSRIYHLSVVNTIYRDNTHLLWIKGAALNRINYYSGGNVDAKLQAVIGRNIRRFRQAEGLTIEELAFRAQLHPNYLGDVERGRRNPSLGNLKKIADGLKKPLTGLLSGVGGTPPVPVREKTAVYFFASEEKDLLSLIKMLRRSTPKYRKHIIRIVKALNARLKPGK